MKTSNLPVMSSLTSDNAPQTSNQANANDDAGSLKEKGNQAFAAGDFDDAYSVYDHVPGLT